MRRRLSLLIGQTFALNWCKVGEEGKMPYNILLSTFFSNSVAESDSNYPDVSVCVQERVCHLILGDSEQ